MTSLSLACLVASALLAPVNLLPALLCFFSTWLANLPQASSVKQNNVTNQKSSKHVNHNPTRPPLDSMPPMPKPSITLLGSFPLLLPAHTRTHTHIPPPTHTHQWGLLACSCVCLISLGVLCVGPKRVCEKKESCALQHQASSVKRQASSTAPPRNRFRTCA